jgi:hypothetical protein
VQDVEFGEQPVEQVLVAFEAMSLDLLRVEAGEIAVPAGRHLELFQHHLRAELDRIEEPEAVVFKKFVTVTAAPAK